MSESVRDDNFASVGFEFIPHPTVYKVSQFLLRAAIGGVHVHGQDNIPAESAVYVPSHRSIVDPVAVGVAIYDVKHEPSRFMAKRELWKFPPLGRWIDAVGGNPITRPKAGEHAKMDELKPFVRFAKNGENVVMFGEGTRQKGLEIGPLFGGALMVAAKAERPVVPVGIAGTKPFKYHRIHIVFGDPIEGSEARELRRSKQEGLDVLHNRMQVVFDAAHRLAS